MSVARPTDPWSSNVQISRQDVKEFLECYPHELLNGARIHVRKSDRAYAQATHQRKVARKTKWHGRALWHLCQAAFVQLTAETLIELEVVHAKSLTHKQLELIWQEAMRRASTAAQVGAAHQGARN